MGQDMRELLSEVAGTSISGRGRVPRYPHSLIWLPAYWLKHPPQRAVAQRLCALARSRRTEMSGLRSLSGANRTSCRQPNSVKNAPDLRPTRHIPKLVHSEERVKRCCLTRNTAKL